MPKKHKIKNTKHSKGKRRRIGKCQPDESETESNDDICGLCGKKYNPDEEWIGCDSCGTWFHRYCVDLSEEDWEYFSVPDNIFMCPFCR